MTLPRNIKDCWVDMPGKFKIERCLGANISLPKLTAREIDYIKDGGDENYIKLNSLWDNYGQCIVKDLFDNAFRAVLDELESSTEEYVPFSFYLTVRKTLEEDQE